MSVNQKRITAREKEVGNEKYAFRCFLLRLGFIGAEFKDERKILLHNLSGNSAFKYGQRHTEALQPELAEARRQLEAAAKAESASLVNQNGDLAMFNVLFSQTQEQVNKMHGLRLKLGKDDGDLDEKLKTAINALADAVRRCAE